MFWDPVPPPDRPLLWGLQGSDSSSCPVLSPCPDGDWGQVSLFRAPPKSRPPAVLWSLLSISRSAGCSSSSPSWESGQALCLLCLCSWELSQDPARSDHLLKDIISFFTVCENLVYKPPSGKQATAVLFRNR